MLEGTKVLLINNEELHLYISGLVRPSDIAQDNSVDSSRLADAQIEFTGRGDVRRSTAQRLVQPRARYVESLLTPERPRRRGALMSAFRQPSPRPLRALFALLTLVVVAALSGEAGSRRCTSAILVEVEAARVMYNQPSSATGS